MPAPGWDQYRADTAPAAAPKDDGKEKVTKFHCASLPDFVEMFLDMYPVRPTQKKVHWCAQWWEHEDAVYRLTIVWHNWEHARLDGSHLSAWMRDHADYHMNILRASDGPFGECRMPTPTEHGHHNKTGKPHATPERPPAGAFPVYETE